MSPKSMSRRRLAAAWPRGRRRRRCGRWRRRGSPVGAAGGGRARPRARSGQASAAERAPPRVRIRPSLRRIRPALERSHRSRAVAAGCWKSASARSISPSRRPSAACVARCAAAPRQACAPGSQRSSQTSRLLPSGPGTSVTASPLRVWTTWGSGARGARASRCARPRTACPRARARGRGASPSARTSGRRLRSGGSCRRTRPARPAPRRRARRARPPGGSHPLR